MIQKPREWQGRTWCDLKKKYFEDSEKLIPPWFEWPDPEDMEGAIGRYREAEIGDRPYLHISSSLLDNERLARAVMLHEMIHQITGAPDHESPEWTAEIERIAGLLGVPFPKNPHTFPLVVEVCV